MPDSQTLLSAVVDAQINLGFAGSDAGITEVAADKGYHTNAQITDCPCEITNPHAQPKKTRHCADLPIPRQFNDLLGWRRSGIRGAVHLNC